MTAPAPRFSEALTLWLKIGVASFGGPAGQIGLMHRELTDRRRWVSEADFAQALNFCMLLPGPEAQQLATFLGLKLHGAKGAVAAGLLFILPGSLVLFALAWLSAAEGRAPWLQAAFRGMAPMVVALVAAAVWRLGKRTLKTTLNLALATGAALALTLGAPFPAVIAAAFAVGLLQPSGPAAAQVAAPVAPGAVRRWAGLTGLFLVLWAAPVGLVVLLAGARPFADVALFFTEAAFVTFGGAYAVLPFVAKAAVSHYGWLSRAEMTRGLSLAETTPGPLILVTQYVGFLAGWNAALAGHAGRLSPLAAGSVAAVLTTWVTFLPCFYFVLAGAPLVSWLATFRPAQSALGGVSSAVVGVIATLGLSLAGDAFFPAGRADPAAMILAAAALIAVVRFNVGALWLVAAGAMSGLARLGLVHDL